MSGDEVAETMRGELVGEDLSAVTFIRDYFQLLFDGPPRLNAYTPVTVRVAGASARSGDTGFSDRLIGQINKVVADVRFIASEALVIAFTDGSLIEVSLIPDDFTGPEAFEYFMRDGGLIVE